MKDDSQQIQMTNLCYTVLIIKMFSLILFVEEETLRITKLREKSTKL